ncbi:MAG TPA: protein kinase [Gemmataceae bacterium]
MTQLILDNQLLEPAQTRELTRTLQTRFTEPKALARELLKRGWLTAYQLDKLFKGRVRELLLGGYIIEERLGEGGMAKVYKARHRLLNRRVALKVIRKDRLADPDAVQRFYREVQAAAQLSHPNIVLAYDADNAGDSYFFAMEYVDGVDLSRLVKEAGPLPVAVACDYIQQAALGLQHAFEQGMVHRDIKPSNLLVMQPGKRKLKNAGGSSPEGADGNRAIVKILDMGLVRVEKSLTGKDEPAEALTQAKDVLGTPDFIAPEQARDARAADIRSDLYSLGGTFYFLLTGQVPFPGNVAMEKLIKHWLEEPQAVTELRPEVPAEVDAIVRKLMAKRPEDRYQSPAELALDLAAFGRQVDMPPQAEERSEEAIALESSAPLSAEIETSVILRSQMDTTTSVRRLQRQDNERRRRMAIYLGAGVLLALLSAVLGIWGIRQLSRTGRATPQPPVVERPEEAFESLRALVGDPHADVDATRRQLLTFRAANAGTPLAREAVGLLRRLPTPWDGLLNKDIPAAKRAPWQPTELAAILGEQRLWQVGPVNAVGLSGDGAFVLSAGADGVLYKRDTDAGRTLFAQRAHTGPITALAVNKEGTIAASGGVDGTVILWDLVNGVASGPIKAHGNAVWCLAFSHDGKTLASGGEDKTAKLWNVSDRSEQAIIPDYTGPVKAVAFSNDDLKLASSGPADVVRLWDVMTKTASPPLPDGALTANALAFAPDAGTLAIGVTTGNVKLWDIVQNSEVATLLLPGVAQLAYAADGKTLATMQGDGAVKLWDTATNKERATLLASPRGRVLAVAFSGDGRTLAAGDDQGEVRVYDPAGAGKERIGPLTPGATAEFLALSPAGRPAIASSSDFRCKAFEPAREEPFLPTPIGLIHAAAFTPDGQSLLLGGDNAMVRICDVAGGREWIGLGLHGANVANGGSIQCVAVAPDGTTAASGSRDGMVYLWSLEKKQRGTHLFAHTDPPTFPVTAVAFSPDGQTLATASRDKKIKLWNVLSGGKPRVLEGSPAGITALAWSADGKTLAAGAEDGVVRLWNTATPKLLNSLSGHSAGVSALACHPETGVIVSAGLDGRLLFHEPTAAKPAREWIFPEPIQGMSLSVDGRYLVTSSNGNVLLFRLAATK